MRCKLRWWRPFAGQDFDCLTVNEGGLRGQADEVQLEFATGQGRVLFTKNTADFRRLDARWRESGRHHAGIVLLTNQRTPIGVQVRAFLTLAGRLHQTTMVDRLEFLLNHA
jgi:hypothetical protein